MCLYSWKAKKKAENDIECYKVLKYDQNGILSSPFQESFKWEVGKEYKDERAKLLYRGEVNEGYFHSYNSYMTAFNACVNDFNSKRRLIIARCIIPKGTYFYQGIHSSGGREGYASKSLKIVEVL